MCYIPQVLTSPDSPLTFLNSVLMLALLSSALPCAIPGSSSITSNVPVIHHQDGGWSRACGSSSHFADVWIGGEKLHDLLALRLGFIYAEGPDICVAGDVAGLKHVVLGIYLNLYLGGKCGAGQRLEKSTSIPFHSREPVCFPSQAEYTSPGRGDMEGGACNDMGNPCSQNTPSPLSMGLKHLTRCSQHPGIFL